jgi:hydrogenase/urease accessory protein HupE
MDLHQNVGMVDRGVRIALGVVLAGIFVAGLAAAPLSYLVALVAAIALLTGLVGFCPLYALLHIGTRPAAR